MQNKGFSKENVLYVTVITLKLLVICALVAALVAAVNFVTADRIVLNQKNNTAKALTEIYSDDGRFFSVDEKGNFAVSDKDGNGMGECAVVEAERLPDIDTVYEIKNADGSVYGYCVEASPMGFKDEVKILVAVNADATAKDVKIISLSDTKGIGDKVKGSGFLDKFKGIAPGFSADTNNMKEIIIAGATRTSEPVTKAVDTAITQIKNLTEEAAQ